MSDPIQSISQNNFLLATQQEVSHDNTLSGNGTVDSPLGVVPGYNETVLFYVDPNSATTDDVTLSESRKNFDHIDIRLFDGNYNTFNFIMIPETSACRGAGSYNAGAQWLGFRAIEVVASDDTTLTISDTPQISFTSAGAFRNFGHGKYGKIYKVIGINRKAQ